MQNDGTDLMPEMFLKTQHKTNSFERANISKNSENGKK
jgi:hypothetical protein